MTTYRICFAALALFAAGCSSVPAPQAQQLNASAKTYNTVSRGLSLAEIEQRIGPALRQEPDGAHFWETRFDEKNYVCLRVWLNAQGRAQDVRVTRGRGVNAPGFHSGTVFTTDK